VVAGEITELVLLSPAEECGMYCCVVVSVGSEAVSEVAFMVKSNVCSYAGLPVSAIGLVPLAKFVAKKLSSDEVEDTATGFRLL
jgi:hypothetical protein